VTTYCVTLPITGACWVEVEAETTEEAINKAIDNAARHTLAQWQAHRSICSGNVCELGITEAHAEPVS
jgi:hypothetical protein